MFDSLILAMIWTFNLAAIVLMVRADLVRKVVLNSWELIGGLLALELLAAVWALVTGQPPAVTVCACWLGLNLLLTVNVARAHGEKLQSGQVVLLCSWWIGLLGMSAAVWHQVRLA